MLQLLDQLPGVECIQEVNEAGTAGKNGHRQVGTIVHVDTGGLLVGVAAVLPFFDILSEFE